MRFLLRSDAGPATGAGHVMRCLTVGEELRRLGHDVTLAADLGGIDWLADRAAAAGVAVRPAEAGTLDVKEARGFDALVLDSYEITPAAVAEVLATIPVLAVIDGDARGLPATRYLDHNLGAEDAPWPPEVRERLIAGSRYALVRREVLEQRRPEPWRIDGRARVVVVLGGTDAAGSTASVAGSIAAAAIDAELTFVADGPVDEAPAGSRLVRPGGGLAGLLGAADVVVTAAGSSAWEIAALGIPAVFIATAANQQPLVAQLTRRGLGLGVDAVADRDAMAAVGSLVRELLTDEARRHAFSERCRAVVDGEGAVRVARLVEALVR